MRTMVTSRLLSLIAVGALFATARADDWTTPKDVARSAHEFGAAGLKLQKAIRDAVEDSPLVAEVGNLSKAADRLHDSVDKGAKFEEARKDFRKVEQDYAHFQDGLKKAHDVHHEKPVEEASKKAKAAFDQLQAQMTGRRPQEKTDPATARPSREDHR